MISCMEYTIISSDTETGLIEHVTAALANGWSLHGGISVASTVYQDRDPQGYTLEIKEYIFAQSMIRLP